MFLVLAGNTDEYEEWQRLHPELDARYVETAKEVLSCDESDSLVIYGSGADREDRDAAQSVALCLRMAVYE